jgi:hypothetical protein
VCRSMIQPTPWSRVFLEKLIVSQLVKEFPPPPFCNTKVPYLFQPRHSVTFHNKLIIYSEELLAPHPVSRLEDHPMLAVRDCLFNIFATSLPDIIHTSKVTRCSCNCVTLGGSPLVCPQRAYVKILNITEDSNPGV